MRDYLGMSTRPVGIKLLQQGKQLDSFTSDKPGKRVSFCGFVHEAAGGKDFLIRQEDLACGKAEISLGFRDPGFARIEPRIETGTAALRIGPVDGADVVMLILNPEQVMTVSMLLQGITARFRKNRAVCGEAMAYVYNTGQPNLTFLCLGARTCGGFETNEVLLGLPYKTFRELAASMGTFATLSRNAKEALTEKLLGDR